MSSSSRNACRPAPSTIVIRSTIVISTHNAPLNACHLPSTRAIPSGGPRAFSFHREAMARVGVEGSAVPLSPERALITAATSPNIQRLRDTPSHRAPLNWPQVRTTNFSGRRHQWKPRDPNQKIKTTRKPTETRNESAKKIRSDQPFARPESANPTLEPPTQAIPQFPDRR